MTQPDFAYAPANDSIGVPLAVSIFADRAHLRDEIRDDAAAAGRPESAGRGEMGVDARSGFDSVLAFRPDALRSAIAISVASPKRRSGSFSIAC